MRTLRIIGIVVMFAGIGLKLGDVPGHTTAFIAGAILIVIPRLYEWLSASRNPS